MRSVSLFVDERAADPLAEQSPSRLCAAVVEQPEQTAPLASVVRVSVDLEVVQGVGIEEHVRDVVKPLERRLRVQQRRRQLELCKRK